jgi:hypothetical protein
VCDFLGVENHAGAAAGSLAPPKVWRQVERPLRAALHAGGGRRPALTVDQRRDTLRRFVGDIGLLEEVTGSSFADWRAEAGRGEFSQRWRG